MTTLKVPDMHCEKCVARITKALTEAELKFEVSLAEKTVKVEGGPAEAEKARAELDDIGFTAEQKRA